MCKARPKPVTVFQRICTRTRDSPGEQVLCVGRGARGAFGKISSLAIVGDVVAFSKNLQLQTGPFFLSAKEEEKQKLLKWSSDLKQEREQLEQKVKQLSNSISVSKPHTFSDGYRNTDLSMYVTVRVAPKG